MIRLSIALILPSATVTAVVPKFFVLGFTHIVPHGADHVLFILALFFLTRNLGVLLFQMTLFTLAHSLTLGLALHGVLAVPETAVEIAIALSIAFIAVENLYQNHLSRWRPWLVFGFGLVHGLGFAHSFRETALGEGEFLPAIFSFNLGIEAGQLAVVGIAAGLVAIWGKREACFNAIARPASTVIAVIGLVWAVRRSF